MPCVGVLTAISSPFFLGVSCSYSHRLNSPLRDPGGAAMPTYILLTTLTAQGVQTLRSNPDRLREVNRDVEELGAKVLHQWAKLQTMAALEIDDFLNALG